MAEHSSIEWTDATWNPITGCSVVSPGCTNCYAMRLAGTRMQSHPSRRGLTTPSKAGPVWNGQVRFNREWLTQPLRWKRPRRIFVCAHGDLFHESVPDAWIDQVFAVMALAPHHTLQVLTKRAERMRAYMTERWQPAPAHRIDGYGLAPIDVPRETEGEDRRDQVHREAEEIATRHGLADPSKDHLWTAEGSCKAMQFGWPLPNVWLGVSAEDQTRADERIPALMATPAAVRFLSAEPLLGPIDLGSAWHGETAIDAECWGDCAWCKNGHPPLHNCQRGQGDWQKGRSGLDLIIAGGESGPGARPMHPDWVRQIRDHCAAAGVAFHFKQWGEWAPGECAQKAPARSEDTATWFDDRWDYGALTPTESAELHTDDEPDLYRLGKKAAGRLLDGREHNDMPEAR